MTTVSGSRPRHRGHLSFGRTGPPAPVARGPCPHAARPARMRAAGLLIVALAGALAIFFMTPVTRVSAAGYLYYKQITIDHTKVTGGADLTNFPVLVSRTDTDLRSVANGGLVQSSNGYDIIFRDASQTAQLDHEIETYVPTTGQVVMWVRIPTLSHTVDTTIFMDFDNSTISSSQENKTGVWDANYTAVWHMSQDPTGTAPQIKDSTSTADHATTVGTWTSGQQAAGTIGGSLNFSSASTDKLTANDVAANDNSSALTVDTWWKPTDLTWPFQGQLLAMGDTGHRYYVTNGTSDSCSACSTALRVEVTNNGSSLHTYGYTSTGVITTGTWYHVVLAFDGSQSTNASRLTLYLNGVPQALTFVGTIPATTANVAEPITMGFSSGSGTYFDGGMDDTRISKTTRSAGWIGTEYNCESSPSTFMSFGTALLLANHGSVTETLATGGYSVLGQGTVAFGATTLTGANQTLSQSSTGYIDFGDSSGSALGWNITAQVSTVFTGTGGLTRTVADGVLNSTTTVTSATAAFTAADVGRSIVGTGIPANDTIATVTNGTTVVLAVSASATASGVSLTFASILPSATISLHSRTALTCDPSVTCTVGTDPATIVYPIQVPTTPTGAAKIFNAAAGTGMGDQGLSNAQTWDLGGTVAGNARAGSYTATITYTMSSGI